MPLTRGSVELQVSDPAQPDPVRTELRLRPAQTGLSGVWSTAPARGPAQQGNRGSSDAGQTCGGCRKDLGGRGVAGIRERHRVRDRLDDTGRHRQRPPRFWSDLITALRFAGPLPAASPVSELAPTEGFGEPEMLVVLAGLAELPVPVVLVLDDFHEVTDGAVVDSVDQLLDHQGANLHVLISTRTDPALGLPRQRLPEPEQGELTEIRSDDLAFTDTESAELFDRSGIQVTAIQRHLLLGRTLGWSAGLRMAALSLEATSCSGPASPTG